MPGQTERVMIRGKIRSADIYKPNEWNKWSVGIYPDFESLEKIRVLQSEGVKNSVKKDTDTGEWYVFFSRPLEIKKRDETKMALKSPEVWDENAKLPDGTMAPFKANIGAGTDATVRLEVYQHPTPNGGKAKAARLHSLIIHNPVELVLADGRKSAQELWD